MVRRRGSTSARLRDAELIEDDWEPPGLPGLVEEDEEVTAELWSFSARLRVASIDGDETWPELGFQSPARKLGEGEELGILGLIHGGGSYFIDDGGRWPSSRVSRRRRRIGCCPVLHRAACRPEVEDDRRGIWAGLILGWLVGCGLVSPSPYFFFLCFFSIWFYFLVSSHLFEFNLICRVLNLKLLIKNK
jgi:hypothetical protein